MRPPGGPRCRFPSGPHARPAAAAWVAAALAIAWPAAPGEAAIEIQARVARRSLTVGETTSLEVVVRGTLAHVPDPEFEVPDGLDVLGSGRSRTFSLVNGRTQVETTFRYELAPDRAGRFRVGPIRVRVGNQAYESDALTLSVSAADARIGDEGRGQGPATLRVDVSPADPYVGQPVIMRVRLIQRASLAEDPRYLPPATSGFWAERPSEPESFHADEARTRVLVTETRTRLYPLAAGETTIGEAAATLALSVPGAGLDPRQWLGGRVPRREVRVRSDPVRVRVRPLPPGAPPGFDGAVGDFTLTWSADRAQTTEDVPVTVRLEVRGSGNLPLLHAPALGSADFEVFASTVEDSLALPGSANSGRRRFQWTVLARRQGRLELAAPAFVWFDPAAGAYRRASPPPIAVSVAPPLAPRPEAPEAFPRVFAEHPLDPFRRAARPWAFALAGLALAAAARLWRRAARPAGDAAERARQREWLQAVRRGSGPDFWAAADRACEWLARRGRPADALRRRIEASRYGGTRADPEAVRRALVERLSAAAAPPPPRPTPRLAAATALALAAVALGIAFGPRAGPEAAVSRAVAADRAARDGDVERARAEWEGLWREGARAAALAARLAWAEVRAGALGPASLWVLRGDRAEPRDPALGWVTGQVREAGGLAGFTPARLPVRPGEWAVAAFLLGAGALVAWPRRWPAAALVALAAATAVAHPLQGWLAARSPRAVVHVEVRLEGTGLALEPGHVVTVLERENGRTRAAAGRGVSGWLPSAAIAPLAGWR